MRNCINLRSPLITESFWRRRAIRRGPANFSIWERKRSSCPKKKRWWKKRGDLWRNAEIGPYYTRDRPADRFLRKDLVSVLLAGVVLFRLNPELSLIPSRLSLRLRLRS